MRKKKSFTLVEVMVVVLTSSLLFGLMVAMTVTLKDRFDDAAETVTRTNASIRYLNQIQIHARGCDEVNIVPFNHEQYENEQIDLNNDQIKRERSNNEADTYKNGDVFFKKDGQITKLSVDDYDIGDDVLIAINNAIRIINVRIGDMTYEIPF